MYSSFKSGLLIILWQCQYQLNFNLVVRFNFLYINTDYICLIIFFFFGGGGWGGQGVGQNLKKWVRQYSGVFINRGYETLTNSVIFNSEV